MIAKNALAVELNTSIDLLETWMLENDIDPGLNELTDDQAQVIRIHAGHKPPLAHTPKQNNDDAIIQPPSAKEKLTSPIAASVISNGVPVQQAEALAFKGASKAEYLFMVEQHAFLSRWAELQQQAGDAFVLDQAEQLQLLWSVSPDDYRALVGAADPNDTVTKAHTSTALDILKDAVDAGKQLQEKNLNKEKPS